VWGTIETRGSRGDFEMHLTVAAEATDFAALQSLVAEQGGRLLHIVLPRGLVPSQPMLSWRDYGELASVWQLAQQRRSGLQQAGFRVTRCKIEAAPGNSGVAQRGDQLLAGQYFECHLKIALLPGADVIALAELAQRHGAHLSRNALRRAEDGSEQRFVTQRVAHAGLEQASEAMVRLADTLTAHGYAPQRRELEFVVFDSNLALDDGWLSGEGS
jgi:hypothetical protein